MAITDGTQPVTPQTQNKQPEIKLNLNFDQEPTPISGIEQGIPKGTNTENGPEHFLLTNTQEEPKVQNTPTQTNEPPMFLKMDTPTNTTPETSPTQDIQLTFTPEENIPIQTTDNISESTTQEVVEPAQPADAWLAQEDALVKETEEKIPSQEKQSEPTIEIQTNKENTTVETNPLQRTEPEVKPEVQQVLETQDTAVVSAPVVEIPQTPTAFQETVNIPVTPIQEEKPIQTEILPQQPLPTENTVVQNIPQMSLQEDMKIIQNISSQTTKPVESLPTETIAQVPQEASSNTLNLDNLLQSNTSAQTTNNVQQIPPTINIMPPIQGTNGVPVSTPIVEEKKTKGTKILLFVLLFVSLGAVGFFIFKTMFPVEFAGIVSLPTGDTMPIEAPFLGSGDILATDMVTGTNLSGEILSGIVVTTGTTEQAATTGQHGSADETMFTDLQDLGSDLPSSDSLVNKLHSFAEQGTKLFEQGQSTGNKVRIKYGGYIRNKATTLANSLASGEQLDTQMVQNYLAQFEGYLSQLQGTGNETNNQGPTEISPSLSGSTPEPNVTPQNGGFSGGANTVEKAQ